MPRFPVILCAVVLAAAAYLGALLYRTVQAKRLLAAELHQTADRATKLHAALGAANQAKTSLEATLAARDLELERTRDLLATAEAQGTQLERTLADTRQLLTTQQEIARTLSEEIAALRQDLAATRAAQIAPETVQGYKNTIAVLERELASARNGAAAPMAAGASTAVFTSRAGRATVLSVGPENAFVVLNFGASRGAEIGQKLAVNRGTARMATVLISDVRPNFSVAQVLPDTVRGVLQKGDSAVLLR